MKLNSLLLIVIVFSILSSCSTKKRSHGNVHFDVIKNTVYSNEDSTYFKALKKYKEAKQNEKIARMQQKIVRENANKIFPDFSFDEVIAYDYDGEMESFGAEIIENNKLTPYKKKAKLTTKQIQNLITNLNTGSTYGDARADCFNPHLGIVFYDKKKIVGYISICLECNYYIAIVKNLAEENHNETTQKVIHLDKAFSEIGVEKLSALCRELDFSHCK